MIPCITIDDNNGTSSEQTMKGFKMKYVHQSDMNFISYITGWWHFYYAHMKLNYVI